MQQAKRARSALEILISASALNGTTSYPLGTFHANDEHYFEHLIWSAKYGSEYFVRRGACVQGVHGWYTEISFVSRTETLSTENTRLLPRYKKDSTPWCKAPGPRIGEDKDKQATEYKDNRCHNTKCPVIHDDKVSCTQAQHDSSVKQAQIRSQFVVPENTPEGTLDSKAWARAKKDLSIVAGTNLSTFDIRRITRRATDIRLHKAATVFPTQLTYTSFDGRERAISLKSLLERSQYGEVEITTRPEGSFIPFTPVFSLAHSGRIDVSQKGAKAYTTSTAPRPSYSVTLEEIFARQTQHTHADTDIALEQERFTFACKGLVLKQKRVIAIQKRLQAALKRIGHQSAVGEITLYSSGHIDAPSMYHHQLQSAAEVQTNYHISLSDTAQEVKTIVPLLHMPYEDKTLQDIENERRFFMEYVEEGVNSFHSRTRMSWFDYEYLDDYDDSLFFTRFIKPQPRSTTKTAVSQYEKTKARSNYYQDALKRISSSPESRQTKYERILLLNHAYSFPLQDVPDDAFAEWFANLMEQTLPYKQLRALRRGKDEE